MHKSSLLSITVVVTALALLVGQTAAPAESDEAAPKAVETGNGTDGPAIQGWLDEMGAEAAQDMFDVNALTTALVDIPGATESGYFGSVLGEKPPTLKILWAAPTSQTVEQGILRGASYTVSDGSQDWLADASIALTFTSDRLTVITPCAPLVGHYEIADDSLSFTFDVPAIGCEQPRGGQGVWLVEFFANSPAIHTEDGGLVLKSGTEWIRLEPS